MIKKISIRLEFPTLFELVTNENKTLIRELVKMLAVLDDHHEAYLRSHHPSFEVWTNSTTDYKKASLRALRSLVKREIIARLKSRATKTKMVWRSENKPYLTKGLPPAAFRF